MKKLFISQPMKGKTNEEIEAERAKAVEEAKAVLNDDVEVIDSFFKDAPVDARPLWFGSWVNQLSYYLWQMLHILLKTGTNIEVVRLSTLVL